MNPLAQIYSAFTIQSKNNQFMNMFYWKLKELTRLLLSLHRIDSDLLKVLSEEYIFLGPNILYIEIRREKLKVAASMSFYCCMVNKNVTNSKLC